MEYNSTASSKKRLDIREVHTIVLLYKVLVVGKGIRFVGGGAAVSGKKL